jgi:hypothetical protein
MGTCPKCEATVSSVQIRNVTVSAGIGGPSWNGIKYLCPTCNCVLSVAIDPVALKNDIVSAILLALGKG